MTASFPAPLDALIAYVTALRPEGEPLDRLAEAVSVADRLGEQADSLVTHFVDQARRSGASWSQIGGSLGVSKQAAQKRFVPRWDGSEAIAEGQLFSRFTPRTRAVLATAGAIAGGEPVPAGAVVAALLSEPEALASVIVHRLGVTDDALLAAFGLQLPGSRPDADPAALRAIDFADDAEDLLRGALTAVLRLGHNYVGTEHLLLGALLAGGPTAETLAGLGVTAEAVEQETRAELARIAAERR